VELAGKHVVITGAASGIGRACATRFAADGARVVVAGAEEAGGPIDLFFSNAGVGGPPGGTEADDDALQMTWQVNVLAHVWAARVLLPAMVQRGDGYLLSTASAAGLLTQLSALEPDEVADAVVAAIAEERFLILPHGEVAKHIAFKGAQPERWLEGMRGLLRQARDQSPPA
jgi:NAD(P)-dependent dehydrogenase (short-subunit alcohol dehydrogenase family)